MFSETYVAIEIIEESQFPPEVQPLSADISSYLDQFPGGRIGRIVAKDRDPYDKLAFRMISNHAHLFTINENDGTVDALEGLDVGKLTYLSYLQGVP